MSGNPRFIIGFAALVGLFLIQIWMAKHPDQIPGTSKTFDFSQMDEVKLHPLTIEGCQQPEEKVLATLPGDPFFCLSGCSVVERAVVESKRFPGPPVVACEEGCQPSYPSGRRLRWLGGGDHVGDCQSGQVVEKTLVLDPQLNCSDLLDQATVDFVQGEVEKASRFASYQLTWWDDSDCQRRVQFVAICEGISSSVLQQVGRCEQSR